VFQPLFLESTTYPLVICSSSTSPSAVTTFAISPWASTMISRATCHTRRCLRSQPKSEEWEEPVLVSYEGSRKNEQFVYSLLRRKSKSYNDDEHWNTSTRTRATHHTRCRRRPRSRRKGKEEVGIPVGLDFKREDGPGRSDQQRTLRHA
jgi:hypothetical protein